MTAYEVVLTDGTREDWLRKRVSGIGASEVAQVMNESPFGGPLAVYARKITGQNGSESESMRWGSLLEEVIASEYEARSGRRIEYRREQPLLRSVAHRWAICTPDGYVRRDGVRGVLEIKTTGRDHGGDWADGPPRHYYLQVQAQMLVTGAPFATIACLVGGQRLVYHDVERDEMTIALIVTRCAEFWALVESRTPPTPDGSYASKLAIETLYPEDNGQVVDLPEVVGDFIAQLDVTKALLKKIEARKYELEHTIKMAIGDASEGRLIDGTVVSYRLQHLPERVSKASEFRVLRVKRPRATAAQAEVAA